MSRPLAVDHGVAEVTGHAVEDRRIQEKGAPIGVQLVQHDLREVVDNEPIRAAEAFEEILTVVAVAKRPARECNDGRPALGSGMKQREGFGREIESQGRVHERVDFIETKGELVRTQLEQVTVRTQPTEGERGILPRHRPRAGRPEA